MEITLDSVIDAARLRLAAVTGEVAGYASLLTLQQLGTGSCAISAASISLTDAGDIVVRSLGPASPHELETALRRLLATLVALCPSAAPAIKSAAERPAGGGLLALESELLTALVPINHAASRRALARLYRETQRADRAARTPPFPGVGLPAARVELGDLDIDVDVDVATQDAEGSMELAAEDPPVTKPEPLVAEPEPPLVADAAPVEREAIDVGREESFSSLSDAAHEPPAIEQPEVDGGCRSDLQELLTGFLSHTRSEERMTRELRKMIGVDPSQGNAAEERGSWVGQGSGARH